MKKSYLVIVGILILVVAAVFMVFKLTDNVEFSSVQCSSGDFHCGYSDEVMEERCYNITAPPYGESFCIIETKWPSDNELEIIGYTEAASGGGRIMGGEGSVSGDTITLTAYVKRCTGACITLARSDKLTYRITDIEKKDYAINGIVALS